MKKKKKKKIIIIVIAILIILLILGFIRDKMRKRKSIDDFVNVKEVLEYYDCKYISTEKSKEEEFEKDVKLEFGKNPIDELYMTSNQEYYENVIGAVDAKLSFKNIRMIDDSRNIIVRVKYNTEESLVEYTINNEDTYFKNQLSERTIEKKTKLEELLEKSITKNIKSEHLKRLENENWSANTFIGHKEKFSDKRYIYWDEAVETRVTAGKVAWIKYTKRYPTEILEGIKVGMNNKQIKDILGNPVFEEKVNSEFQDDSISVIGYIINRNYVFFADKEIYICPIASFDKEKDDKLIKAFNEMNQNGDYVKFVDSLTTIYPEYLDYYSDDSHIGIQYPNLGFSFNINTDKYNGITFYSNYLGKLEFKDNSVMKNNVYLKLDQDYMFEFIKHEIETDKINREPGYGGPSENENEKYNIKIEGNKKYYYSIDKTEKDYVEEIE